MLHKTLDVGAVGAMHRNATTARDEADDIVARHRITAMRQTDQQSAVALALDDNAVAGALATLLRLAVGAAGRLFHDLGDSSALVTCSSGLGSKICSTLLPTARGATLPAPTAANRSSSCL